MRLKKLLRNVSFVSEVICNFLEEMLKEEVDSVEDIWITEALQTLVAFHKLGVGKLLSLIVFFYFHFELVYF